MRRLSFVIAVVAAAACSRTALRESISGSATSGGDAGGGTATSASMSSAGGGGAGGTAQGGGGAGGDGGVGGPPLLCGLAESGRIGLGGAGDIWAQADPVLTSASDDASRVLVASAWQVTEGPGEIPPAELRHTTFEPWTSWPSADIGPTFLAGFDGGYSFAASEQAGDRVSLLFSEKIDPGGPTATVRYMPGIEPGSGVVPPSAVVDGAAERSLFIATRGSGALLGFDRHPSVMGGFVYQFAMGFGTNGPNGPGYDGSWELGCATDPMSADAMPTAEGFIVALSHGETSDPSCQNAALVGPAKVLALFRVSNGGPLLAETEPGGAPIAAVRMAKHGGGAWLAWARYSGGASSTISVVQVNDGAYFDDAIVTLDAGGYPILSSLAASALGDGVTLAWLAGPDDGPPAIEVRALAESGALLAATTVVPDGSLLGFPVVLGSPDGERVLVAWSETPNGSIASRVRLVLLGCP